MHRILWRHPMLAARVLPSANRYRSFSINKALMLICVVLATGLAGIFALHHRVDSEHAWPPLVVPIFLIALTAILGARRAQLAVRTHQHGWMEAWPIEPNMLARWLMMASASNVFARAVVPAALAGVLLSTSGCGAMLLNLAGCAAGALAGASLGLHTGSRWQPSDTTTMLHAPLVPQARPFLGLQQLDRWQRSAIGRSSMRRWVLWVTPVLLVYPAANISARTGVSLLLLLFAWPWYGRAITSSLNTLIAAADLLRATPLVHARLLRRLLPFPVTIMSCVVLAAGCDLLWLGQSISTAIGVALGLLLLEALRIGRAWHASCHGGRT